MSMTEPQTREAVVAAVMAMDAPQEAADAAPVAAASDDAPVGDEASGEVVDDVLDNADNPDSQDQGDDGAETQTEVEDEGGQAVEAVEAPQFWSKEAKDNFATLPPETQSFLIEQDKAAQKAIGAKFEEAAAARKAAEAKAASLTQIGEQVQTIAEQAEAAFGSRWANFTDAVWLKLSQDDPQKYIQYKAQYDAEQTTLQQAQAARDVTARIERERWLAQQAEDLKTHAPELVDPVKGQERIDKVRSYLLGRGVAEQDLTDISAGVAALAWDSYQLHELRKNKPQAAIKPAPKAGVAPAASSSVPPPQRELARLQNRFNQTGSREDAVKLLLAKGG
jgi:hypothetical protein